jgi:hypothetical protein
MRLHYGDPKRRKKALLEVGDSRAQRRARIRGADDLLKKFDLFLLRVESARLDLDLRLLLLERVD